MDWLILAIVSLHVAVQAIGLYWRMRTGDSVRAEHFDHLVRIEAKLDKLLPRKMRGAKADVVILDELLGMKVKLVFDDWRDGKHKSVYSSETGVDLSKGDFHSGTTFKATIMVDDPDELRSALERGYHPVFYVVEDK